MKPKLIASHAHHPPRSPEGERKPVPKRRPKPIRRVDAGDAVDGLDGLSGVVPPGLDIVAEVASFFGRYIALPSKTLLVVSAWVVAAWLAEVWDRFPHLAITSPEKRCGKTRFLQLLELVLPRPHNTANISPAAIYRLIDKVKPSLLFDEAQSISRRGSEAAEVTRELLNAAIDRKAKVIRCGGKDKDQVVEFSVYCPKVVALIGTLDSVLADRCLPVAMVRKTEADAVEPIRSRVVEPVAAALKDRIEKWAEENRGRVAEVYDAAEPFPIPNDRLAELLLPLQAVLAAIGHPADDIDGVDEIDGVFGDTPRPLVVLREYADSLEEKEGDSEKQSEGAILLGACRDIYSELRNDPSDLGFLSTTSLLVSLLERKEEGWGECNRGGPITEAVVASLLRPYGIKPVRNRKQTSRGYYEYAFKEVWARYLPPPLKTPSIPSIPSAPSKTRSPNPTAPKNSPLAAHLKGKGVAS